ncbi:ABC transporter substrate-binding protein [Kineosporia babensis]|uniref:ABC transporter substrate-binding protein n=1 Tax=Kineosporia babensis TaxID=499548 RepID=A0A9X1NHZ5_9ACTN|nr:ABC transporter substrate-binding protein [Kineosporia babensis]MCD5314385.1 ABC transporter substrate-binding protein [Kineosporia babensis]
MTNLRRHGAALAAGLLSATIVLTACGSDDADDTGAASTQTAETSETRTVTADNGSIEVSAAPRRIVTIGNTGQPIVDLGGKPVGITEVAASTLEKLPEDQQATFAAATIVGPEGGEVDLEKVAGLTPDLILVQLPDDEFEAIEKQLETIAPTLFYGLDTEWKAFADKLAEAGNLTQNLSAQKTEFAQRVSTVQEKYGKLIDGSTFVDVSRGDWNDPGTFYIADIGCSEIARDDIGLDLPEAAAGQDPLAYESLPFEQIGKLSEYDVITYPVEADGQPTEAFAPVVETNTWKALPTVTDGKALGVFCPGNNSYGPVLQYLESLERALAKLPAQE